MSQTTPNPNTNNSTNKSTNSILKSNSETVSNIGFVGFGEAATAFSSGIKTEDKNNTLSFYAFDIKTDSKEFAEKKWQDYQQNAIQGCQTLNDLLVHSSLIFSLVTADQAIEVAKTIADLNHINALHNNILFLDCNSCSPQSKQMAEQLITAVGGRYVDVAVMSPVYPQRHLTPLLLSGPHAEAASEVLNTLGMNASIVGEQVGQASAIKLIRSIMVKGMEALSAECFLAAKKLNVDDQVLASLHHSSPELRWHEKSFYNLERMAVHGIRRSAEMQEAANMLNDLQLDHSMTSATMQWQAKIGNLNIPTSDNNFNSQNIVGAGLNRKETDRKTGSKENLEIKNNTNNFSDFSSLSSEILKHLY